MNMESQSIEGMIFLAYTRFYYRNDTNSIIYSNQRITWLEIPCVAPEVTQ